MGRVVAVPKAAKGVARFEFSDLCEKTLGAPDYLAIAKAYLRSSWQMCRC